MTAAVVWTEICELEELKKETTVMKSVLGTAQSLLALKDESQLKLLALLMSKLRSSYSKMLEKVRLFKLTVTKTNKLWVLFHNFSLKEGYQPCKDCDSALGLNAHDTFRQLLMEKEFHQQVTRTLKPASVSSASCARSLTTVEENAIRYTAGYHGMSSKKLETKYSKKRPKRASNAQEH